MIFPPKPTHFLRIGEKVWRAYLAKNFLQHIIGIYGVKLRENEALVFLFKETRFLSFHHPFGKTPLYIGFFRDNRLIHFQILKPREKTPKVKANMVIEWIKDPELEPGSVAMVYHGDGKKQIQ